MSPRLQPTPAEMFRAAGRDEKTFGPFFISFLEQVASHLGISRKLKENVWGLGSMVWALPFLVGGVIRLVNSVNERDLKLSKSYRELRLRGQTLRGTLRVSRKEV
jgi:hypothetical protein